jgi:hypothetical protein
MTIAVSEKGEMGVGEMVNRQNGCRRNGGTLQQMDEKILGKKDFV